MGRRPVQFVAVGLALALVAACGRSADKPIETAAPPTTEAEATTTSKPAPPLYPLTGLPIQDPGLAQHPALVVKIDNSPDAGPQWGVNQADVVYELLVEGITRYAVVFHSDMPDKVGPVRSARSSDIELLANLGGALIAWSGGNPGVINEVRTAVDNGFLVDAGHDAVAGEYHRDGSRRAPHNLYTSAAALLQAAAPAGVGGPPPLFSYRAVSEPYVGGSPETGGYIVDFGGGVHAQYVWDVERRGWDRYQRGVATVDADGMQVSPQNVVIMFLGYGQSPSDARSPMALSTGEGDAVVLTDGKAIVGRWQRPNALSGWSLVDQAGNPIRLTPGRTWVALPEVGSFAGPIAPEEAAALLAARA